MSRLRAAWCMGVVSLMVGGGCGSEDEEPSKATPLRVTASEAGNRGLVYSAPRRVRAGLVRITLHNRGRRRHKAQLFRVDGNHSLAQAQRVRRRLPDWLRWEGGVGMTAPGKTSSVTQRLQPGKYYITDNRGADARVAPLTVVGERGDASLPQTGGSIVFKEYSFTTSGFRPGGNSIELVNEGLEPHHAVVAPVKPGASVSELRRFLRGSGPIPVGDIVRLHGAAETSVIEGGQRQVVDLQLRRGKYALLCFVPDRAGGPSHVAKGMVDQLTVR